jgi:hypothetical protein
MNKMLLLKIVNPLLGLSFLVQAITGIMLTRSIGISFIDKTAHIHEANGTVFLLLVIIHLTLNWSWVKATFFKKSTASIPLNK